MFVPMFRRSKAPAALLVSLVVALGACTADKDEELRLSGGVENFTIQPEYEKFCAAYDSLNIALNEMSKTGSTKENFAVVIEKSKALVEASPEDIASAVLSNDAILNAMNKAFEDRGYDEEKISEDEGLRQEVQALYSRDGLAELTTQFADYLVKNCGVSTE